MTLRLILPPTELNKTMDAGPNILHRGLWTISNREIQWQRMHRPPPKPSRRNRQGNVSSSSSTDPEEEDSDEEWEDPTLLNEEDEEGEDSGKPKEWMVFLLSDPGDYFSRELDDLVNAVAPCFPSVLFLRGLSSEHNALVVQMTLRSLPQLFLFEDSLLKVRHCLVDCRV